MPSTIVWRHSNIQIASGANTQVTQWAVLELAQFCNDWQTPLASITQQPDLPVLMHALCPSYSARQFQSALHYIRWQILELTL